MVAETTSRTLEAKPKFRSYLDSISTEIEKANGADRQPKFKVAPGSKEEAQYTDLFEKTRPLREVLKEARLRKDYSQSDLATMLNIKSSEFIGMVENGQRRFELNRIPAIADALGLDAKKLCRLALFEDAPLFAMAVFGNDVSTFTPTAAAKDKKQQKVSLSPEQLDYMVRLYSLPSPLRYTILDLIEKFTVLIKSGPSRLSKNKERPTMTSSVRKQG